MFLASYPALVMQVWINEDHMYQGVASRTWSAAAADLLRVERFASDRILRISLRDQKSAFCAQVPPRQGEVSKRMAHRQGQPRHLRPPGQPHGPAQVRSFELASLAGSCCAPNIRLMPHLRDLLFSLPGYLEEVAQSRDPTIRISDEFSSYSHA